MLLFSSCGCCGQFCQFAELYDVRPGWHHIVSFRVYNRNESRYSFESTIYLYHRLPNEYAPEDEVVIIQDGL